MLHDPPKNIAKVTKFFQIWSHWLDLKNNLPKCEEKTSQTLSAVGR